LQQVKEGRLDIDQAMEKLRHFPYEDLDCACIDHHRGIRTGFPEVIFCPGKSEDQVIKIFDSLAEKGNNILATRAEQSVFDALVKTGKFPNARYEKQAKAIVLEQKALEPSKSILPIITARTADIPVAEEAKVTAQIMGQRCELICDIGVAGLHRLLGKLDRIKDANVLLVIAGMDGALPGVVAGLVSCPVIAVPTSIGYGTGLGGIAALLTMLNSCATGVSVVNIDNGFSAAVTATMINRKIEGRK
jgi:pyridinium-3,5-biscarboxylic acid mononucleotide synthase